MTTSMMRANQKQLCLVIVLILAFAVPLSTTSDSQNPGSSGQGEEPLEATNENTPDTPVGGGEVGAANASVVETNVTQVNDTAAVGGNDTAGAAGSVPVSRPPPLRKIRCLKKRVVFNVSQVEEEAGSTLEEKSHRISDQVDPKVRLVNATLLTQLFSEAYSPNVTNRSVAAQCHLVMFYGSWCPFSAAAAPHFNGLARVFPDLNLYAVDSSKSQGGMGINTQFGIIAIPTLVLFHNTRQVTKYNQTDYVIDKFAEFVEGMTFLERSVSVPDANVSGDVEVALPLTPEDMEGPVPTKAVPLPDYYLSLAWAFTLICAVGYFAKSTYCQMFIESIRNNWREAEIQHEHID